MSILNNSRNPLVSIITPSFNQGNFIKDTILSVKNQDYPTLEHIIIDGGSADQTINILKKYEDSYNMKWISEPDEGQTDAILKGLELSKGNIATWLNSDDLYVYKDSISSVVKAFNNWPEVKIIYGHAIKINSENKIMRIKVVPEFSYERLKHYDFIIQPSCFWRNEIHREQKLNLSLNYSMDYEYWLRLGKDYKWRRIKKIISADRNYPGRKIISYREESSKETRRLRKEFNVKENKAINFKRKLILGVERIKGLAFIPEIMTQPLRNFAFDVKRDNLFSFIKNQLIKKDRELL